MKIVYALVCSAKDYYYEQALVSVVSLKHVMPDSFVSLLIDDESYSYVKEKDSSFFERFDECKIIPFKKGESPKIKSRYMKTRMRQLLSGRLLYIDVDTVWVKPINESDFYADVMAEYDFNSLFSLNPLREWILNICKKADCPIIGNEYFNGGVIFFDDTEGAKGFAKSWAELWDATCKKNVFVDQPALNYVNEKKGHIITRLNPYCNVQMGFSLRYFCNAKLLHYFATDSGNDFFESSFHFKQKKFWDSIKKNGLTDKLLEDVYKPMEAFELNTIFVSGLDYRNKIEEYKNLHADHASYSFIETLISSKKKWPKKLLNFLDCLSKKIISVYNRINF